MKTKIFRVADQVFVTAEINKFSQKSLDDFETLGMMLIETQNHKSKVDQRKRLVYVETLETAPWNRPNSEPDPQFKRVGTALLREKSRARLRRDSWFTLVTRVRSLLSKKHDGLWSRPSKGQPNLF